MADSPLKPLQNPRSRRPAKAASPGVLFLIGLLFFLFAAAFRDGIDRQPVFA
jgi:hypothetical protein